MKLTQEEKEVLAQALAEYQESVERAVTEDEAEVDLDWLEDVLASIERKLD